MVGALRTLKEPVLSLTSTAPTRPSATRAAGIRSRVERQAAAAAGAIARASTAFSPPSHESSAVTASAPTEAPTRSAR
ncbi:MAG: hypothetical protein A2V74_09900 [Acidobacteria bacterium RBG_16_70_10]|nr:MAG: hypothetical protein A2V74_09900 [Acidobacteria bacterium RBG_16_70_10]